MLNRFRKYIEENKLFDRKDKILLAVSGGVDSVVLCVLMKQAGFNFGIAHCNFKLRGEDSDGDEAFVRQVSDFLQVPLFLNTFDTNKIAKDEKNSIQIVARKLRYDWFEELLERENYHYLATAHHLNDSIETVLFNFSRGCGIRGMHGILPKKNKIIRPLNFATKDEIIAHANALELTWREDVSNESDKYIRNHIRLNIIPELKEINPNFERNIERTIQRLRDAEVLMDFAIAKMKEEVYTVKGKNVFIDIEKMQNLPTPQTSLYEMVKDFGFNGAQIKQVLNADFSQSGKLFSSTTHQMLLGRKYLIIREIKERIEAGISLEEGQTKVELEEGDLVLKYTIGKPETFPLDKNITFFDADKITYPLKLRRWKKGDVFQPLGMKGRHRKLSDFMIDQKLSLFEKEALWILESDGHICWVIGQRPDERFKVDKTTTRCLRLEWEE